MHESQREFGFTFFNYEVIDSTNSEAWRLIDRGQASSHSVIIAKRQSQGRGQRGHLWQSDLGGLYMSVILQPHLQATDVHRITLWAAWGIAKKLNATGVKVQIKWLNDLLIDHRKLGGILTETRIEGGRIVYAVVGIGINWTNTVPERAIALGELPTTLSSMEDLIEVVLDGILLGQTTSDREGMSNILQEYLAMLSDRQVSQTIDQQEHQGEIIDIRPTGELVVRWKAINQDCIYQPQHFSVGYTNRIT
ncbi:MAG: biotin--[acetyl-CoA-carboxylase] ligase [Pseudanabaenaceae cyanobacterium bins.39]|nr:biotin--[acetyl-CoA-carboxylase] ligase [Pseudanabaenaceae cyanobacterium bins.39]